MIKKKKQVDPELKQILNELEDIVRRLGYKVRYEKGDFEGGYCLLKESKLFLINSRKEIERKISIISKNLKELGIDEIFVKPNIREIIEKESLRFKREEETGEAETLETETGEAETGETETHKAESGEAGTHKEKTHEEKTIDQTHDQ